MGIDELIHAHKPTIAVRSDSETCTSSVPQSELDRVLRQATGGAPKVPPGWGRLRQDAERMLLSATASVASRRELRVTDVYMFGSQPVVRLSAHDPVVHGIYRRTLARTRHTCQSCSRAGRVWECLSQFRVLCARCAAPHVVAAELDTVEALRERVRRAPKDSPIGELPPRLAAVIATALHTEAQTRPHDDSRRTQLARATTRDELDR